MKTLMKYSKWLLAAAVLCTAPVFTACDNDDDIVVAPLPEKFSTVLSSLSINWDETEGVVDFEAPAKWKAESACEWIELDPTSGAAGKHRLWLNVTPNPYMLPRTGEIHINCGDDSGKIVVTQAGAPAETVAPTKMSLEVLSLDYATEELSFSAAASDIQGNLGLTLDEFSKGVADDGNLEFFMIGKDGQWISGGTAGTRCSAWLDKDLNVTWWDGNGYPSNAAFIEVYGGIDEETGAVMDPTIVVGRAPGVPDNQEYDLKFGFTFKEDHSKYTLFDVHVLFVPMDLKGTIVKTIDMDVDVTPNDGYSPTPAVFDAADVAAALGASSITLAKVVSYDANGDFLDYTANNGYWFSQDGNVGKYGENSGWFIEYWGGDDADAETNSAWQVGPFPGVTDVAATSKIGFWYNNNVVMFNLHIKIGEGGGGGEEPQIVDVVNFLNLSINVPANDGYVPVLLPFDGSVVEASLGVPASECQVVALNDDGSLIGQTANNGFWYAMDGTVNGWGEGDLCFIEYHGDEDEELKTSFNVGPFPGATGSAIVQIGFMHDNKVVLYDVNVTVE